MLRQVYVGNNKYIVFDVETKYVSKLKKRFVIPEEDTIIAYYEPLKLPAMSGIEIVFTDRALYTLIGRKKPLKLNGIGFSGIIIDYDKLCCYIASHDKYHCVLFNYDAEIRICKKPLLMRSAAWEDAKCAVVQMVQSIQKTAMASDYNASLSYQKAKQAFRFIVEDAIEKCSPLDRTYYYTALEEEPELAIHKYKLLINDFKITSLNNISVTPDEERILLKYVDQYIQTVRSVKKEILTSVCRERVKALKTMLVDDCTNSITQKLYQYKDQFIAYNSIREDPYSSLNFIVEQYLGAFPDQQDRYAFIMLAISLRNKDMAVCLEGLINHSIASIRDWDKKCDFFGLTALHYAIITCNEEIAMKGIKLSDDSSKLNLFLADMNDQLYDYAALAFLLNNKKLGDFLLDSTGEIALVRKRIKNLERLLKLRELSYNQELRFYTEGNKRIREARRNAPDRVDAAERIAAGEDRINTLKNHLESSKCMIEDLKAEIRELQDQIEQMKNSYRANLSQNIERLKRSSLYQFYVNPKLLSQYLKETDRHIVIQEVNGRYTIDVDSIRMDDLFRGESQFDYGEKPYGDSWFSPDAHRDYDTLKKEYRQYAKKYHPDILGGSAAVFNEIGIERDAIIEGLK